MDNLIKAIGKRNSAFQCLCCRSSDGLPQKCSWNCRWMAVGGHKNHFVKIDEKTVLKLYDENEYKNLVSLRKVSLSKFIPYVYSVKTYHSKKYIVMQDMTFGISSPSIIDIKLGCITFSRSDLKKHYREKPSRRDLFQKIRKHNDERYFTTTELKNKEISKYRYLNWRDITTTTRKFSIRISAMKIGDIVENNFNHVHSLEEMSQILNIFIQNSQELKNIYEEKISELVQLAPDCSYLNDKEIIGCSLLLVHNPINSGQVQASLIDFAKLNNISKNERLINFEVNAPPNYNVTVDDSKINVQDSDYQILKLYQDTHKNGFFMGLDNVINLVKSIKIQ